ncbi:hypothetical protein D9619_003987 [Psilocybe cf. subviscida]|uniref:Uncharacterized protein n=1 Tax=Psilocybe cf. subviscida TaxID=2480587 RepID=A0A8H5BQK6_9AGAR|nr:hypothetical protein D9619_003987 [Psilocybe cf. subviscida]
MATVVQRLKSVFVPSTRRTEPPTINTSTSAGNRQEPSSPATDSMSPITSLSTDSIRADEHQRTSTDSGVAGLHFEESPPPSSSSRPSPQRSQSADGAKSESRKNNERSFTLPLPFSTGRTRSGSTPYRNPPSPGTSALEHVRLPSFPGAN